MWRLRFRNIKNKNENLFHIYVSCDNGGLAAAMFQGELSEQETAEGKKMPPGCSSTQHPLECSQGSGLDIHLVASALTKFTQNLRL